MVVMCMPQYGMLLSPCCVSMQIGVAVGDIDKVERNAYIQKTGLQVKYNSSYNLADFLLTLLI